MAILTEYTPKQQNAMNKLAAKATRYKMKIDEINRRLAAPVISFEENSQLREKRAMFVDLYRKTSDEISEIANQKQYYDEHIVAAKEHINAAEEITRIWGIQA